MEGLRLRTPVGFSESNPAISYETDRPPCGSLDFMNVADVESQGARYRDVTHCLHLFKCVGQTVVLTFLKGLDQNLSVLRSGILVDYEPDGEVLSQLCARAIGSGIDRLSGITGESCNGRHGQDRRCGNTYLQSSGYDVHLLLRILWHIETHCDRLLTAKLSY